MDHHRDMAIGSGDDDWSSIARNALRLERDRGRRLRLASERRGRRRGDPGDRDVRQEKGGRSIVASPRPIHRGGRLECSNGSSRVRPPPANASAKLMMSAGTSSVGAAIIPEI